MRYKDIKIVERDLNKVASEIVMPIEKYFKKDCNDENRINQQLTNLRKNLAKYPEKRNPVIQRLGRSFPVLAKLVKGTVYPIQIARSGFSMPEYKKEMCSGGVADSGTGTKDGTGITGGKDGTVTTGNKDGIGNKDGSTGQTINDKFGTEMQTFGEFLDSNDLEGALAFLDGNPEFETAIGSKFRTDIQSALDAQEAKESNRLAQEKAAKEAKEAKEKADAAAAKEAKEKADAAAEAKRIAAEEEQARLDAIEAEAEAARIEQEEEAARLEKEAEDARIAAEKLEKERIEAEAEAQRIADQEETDNNSEGVEEFDWEELQ